MRTMPERRFVEHQRVATNPIVQKKHTMGKRTMPIVATTFLVAFVGETVEQLLEACWANSFGVHSGNGKASGANLAKQGTHCPGWGS